MSVLGRYIRKQRDKEGLNHSLYTVALPFNSATANATQRFVLPVDSMLVAATATAKASGLTSGTTQIAIDNETQTQVDLDGGQLDMAYNDSDNLTSSDILNGMTVLKGVAGDVYLVTIDAAAATEATDLTVILTFATL